MAPSGTTPTISEVQPLGRTMGARRTTSTAVRMEKAPGRLVFKLPLPRILPVCRMRRLVSAEMARLTAMRYVTMGTTPPAMAAPSTVVR